jgi:hypothetical protein
MISLTGETASGPGTAPVTQLVSYPVPTLPSSAPQTPSNSPSQAVSGTGGCTSGPPVYPQVYGLQGYTPPNYPYYPPPAQVCVLYIVNISFLTWYRIPQYFEKFF